ncbi:diacylglycerol kinase family protein [Oceanobacillus massiliensis]|uniref:diacylglycerol kinase family protein n=1 Tax=Oceanobacillus massiliensis TaxID=1465765 RepID=UPI00028A143E|nr:diacylglycerol kinase family protein [Oceanobacillus massiliensis]
MSLELKDKRKIIGFSYAWNGLKEIVRSERNFRIHLTVTVLVIITGLLLHLSALEWGIIILTIGLVLTAEVTNSAIEKTIDYLRPEIHPSAKVIKDVAAGAVLVAAVISVVIGVLIFWPKIESLIF